MARARILLSVLVLAGMSAPAGATSYQWSSAVSGSAADPNRWSPIGVPGGFDQARFTVPGTYTVTLPGTVPGTNSLTVSAGSVTLSLTNGHSTGGVGVSAAVGQAGVLTVNQAAGMNYGISHGGLSVGSEGASTTLNVINGTWLRDVADGIDFIGWSSGSALLNISGGSRVTSNRLQVSEGSAGSAIVSVAGSRNTTPPTYTGLQIEDADHPSVIGADTLSVFSGGWTDAAGSLILGEVPGASGIANIGPGLAASSSWLNARKFLCIGNNEPLAGGVAGHGEVTVLNRAWINVDGGCQVGDPHNDTSSFLRVMTGGSASLMGGLLVWPVSGPALDLRGGATQVRGGLFDWKANKPWIFSSTVGSPVMTIANGLPNVGPSSGSPLTTALFLGRSGAATLNVIGANTRLPIAGAVTLSDSVGGSGTLAVDTLAVVDIDGSLAIGNRSAAIVSVLRGAQVRARTVSIGLAPGSTGHVYMQGLYAGTPTRFHAIDNVWMGGTSSGVGGSASVEILEGSGMIVSPSGVSPSVATLYSGSSIVLAGDGFLKAGLGHFRGAVFMEGGSIDCTQSVIHPTGIVNGHGWFEEALINNGWIDVNGTSDAWATLGVGGSFQQTASGVYECNVGSPSASDASDTLLVLGPATLGGGLYLNTTPGFEPQPGDTLTVLLCASRIGTFDLVLWDGQPITGHAEVLYGPTSVKIVVPGLVGVSNPGVPVALRFVASAGPRGAAFLLDLPADSDVDVQLYDVAGRRRAVLARGPLAAGSHRIDVAGGIRAVRPGRAAVVGESSAGRGRRPESRESPAPYLGGSFRSFPNGHELHLQLVVQGAADALEHAERVTLVVCILQPGDDRIAGPDKGRELLLRQARFRPQIMDLLGDCRIEAGDLKAGFRLGSTGHVASMENCHGVTRALWSLPDCLLTRHGSVTPCACARRDRARRPACASSLA
jgi:hypothetical protein